MKRGIHIALFLVIGLHAIGQTDLVAEAFRKYQDGALNEARVLVQEALQSPDHAEDPEAWLLQGFILKDIFKSGDTIVDGRPARDEAIASLARTIMLDSAGRYRDNAQQAYDFLAKTYFNDAARALNELHPRRAGDLFEDYVSAMNALGRATELNAKRIEFENALGTVHTKLYNQDREDLTHYDLALRTYERVLEVDPDNYGANYNLATLYYNRGVYNIQRIGAENDIPSLQRIQEVSRSFFMQALPYMLKAFEMNPKRRETLLGLEGIYYSLQDTESSEHYRQLYEALGPEDDH
ncbi:MAG: tetratricopeptide repeat protein [Flavobacteriales bacterium]|nr:tetratricopeptide repeat protein [Flavobacteriales bacterium]MCB9167063.1 tetratricopeptide repeat protein [Flavobacteriales bacterium]